MMKRDLQKFKYVAGDKVENKPYENKYNKSQNYRYRDIDEKRLPKWDLIHNFSQRTDINSKHHEQSLSQITKFQPSRKQFGQNLNQNQIQSQENTFKPTLKQIIQERREVTPTQRRQIQQIIHDQKLNGSNQNMNYLNKLKNCEGEYEMNLIDNYGYDHHNDINRTRTPNARPIQNRVVCAASKETDIINQRKYLLPSMRNISSNQRQCLTTRNQSSFTLAWDA